MRKAVYSVFVMFLLMNVLIFTASCGSDHPQETQEPESSMETESSMALPSETETKRSEETGTTENTSELVVEPETTMKPSQSEREDVSKKLIEIENKAAETEEQPETHRLSSVEPEIEKIKKIYNDIDSKKEKMRTEKTGGTVRYFDEDGYIRMIIAEPYTYDNTVMDEEIQNAKAYYFYDVVDGIERECFVFVITGNGDYYRFYLTYDPVATDLMNPDSVDLSTNCIRYIDRDGDITDYLDYVDPADISKYGIYCHEAYMEIVWAYEGDY